ncbi:CoA pyrophosphatase [Amaricoccus tamworthensis]|uniref:CoA pyrophosphatase n=1 Tax=Amaricoccus tamworthensis TaxID=57002 RepID=UPI003C7E4017
MDVSSLNLNHIEHALTGDRSGSSDFDLNPSARPAGDWTLRPASVLVPLTQRGSELNMVLTRRTMGLRHHPGQVSFPGGKQEHDDQSPMDTALRETEEEIGLAREKVEILGRFDGHETVTGFMVTPFVGIVHGDFKPVPDRSEVESVFEVPLSFVLNPSNLQMRERMWKGQLRPYYVIPYGPWYIWGATARIIKSLGDRVYGR